MKKTLFVVIIGLLSCITDVSATTTDVSTVIPSELRTSSKVKVVKRGDRVIIIYSDGTVVIVDKNGNTVYVPGN